MNTYKTQVDDPPGILGALLSNTFKSKKLDVLSVTRIYDERLNCNRPDCVRKGKTTESISPHRIEEIPVVK